MTLFPSRAIARLLPLTGVSFLALSSVLYAQQGNSGFEDLGVIKLIVDGEENVEATGGTEISAEDLQRLQPSDVSDLFSRESSVSVSGGGGAAKKVTVLGVEQSLLATSIDGVPQPATAWHHTGSSTVDPAFLKAVKVEAGAAAADAGFGAAAGSLRYETVGAKDLLEDGKNIGARAALSYGSNGRGTVASLAGYGRHAGFDWLVMTNSANGKSYQDGNGKEALGTDPASLGVVAKFGFETDEHRLEVTLDRSRDDADRLAKANLSDAANTALYALKVSRDSLKLTYTSLAPTEVWDPELSLYLSKFEYWRPNYATNNNGDAIFNEAQFGGKVQNTFTTELGQITAGVDFNSHDYATDNHGDGGAPVRQYRNFSTQQVGLFAQGRFEFNNGFNLSTGARFDHHRFDTWDGERFSDSGASVNGTLSYDITDSIEVFAGASNTWLGYVIGDYGYVHARNNNFAVDPKLRAGEAENYKLGANFGAEQWQAGVTLFDTKISNLFHYDRTILKNNPAKYRSKGVTLHGKYDFGATQIGGSYTEADVTANGIDLAPSNGVYLAPVGAQATLYIDHEVAVWQTMIGASLQWADDTVGGKTSPATNHSYSAQEGYTVVNAYAEWTPSAYEGLAVRFGVDNIFDAHYSERSGFGTATAANGSVLEPVWGPGRTLTLNASYKF